MTAAELIAAIRNAPDPCTICLGFATIPPGASRVVEVDGLTTPFLVYRVQGSALPAEPGGRGAVGFGVAAVEVDGADVDMAKGPHAAARSVRVTLRNPTARPIIVAAVVRGRWADEEINRKRVDDMIEVILEAVADAAAEAKR